MKYELDKEEFQAIHKTLLEMTEMLCDTIKFGFQTTHNYEMQKLMNEHEQFKLKTLHESSHIKQAVNESTVSEVMPFTVIDNDEDNIDVPDGLHVFLPKNEFTEHQRKGFELFQEMIRFWLVGYRDEEAEQPNRGEYVEKLGQKGKQAGAIVSYCMAVGGLTKACWNVIKSDPVMSETMDAEEIRYLAGNITQVASIHLHPLADQFEYPNPLESYYE